MQFNSLKRFIKEEMPLQTLSPSLSTGVLFLSVCKIKVGGQEDLLDSLPLSVRGNDFFLMCDKYIPNKPKQAKKKQTTPSVLSPPLPPPSVLYLHTYVSGKDCITFLNIMLYFNGTHSYRTTESWFRLEKTFQVIESNSIYFRVRLLLHWAFSPAFFKPQMFLHGHILYSRGARPPLGAAASPVGLRAGQTPSSRPGDTGVLWLNLHRNRR